MIYINGIPATQVHVGDTAIYNVPGYSQVWLYQLKDGATQWNGPYTVPSTPYTFTEGDIGHYDTYAYQLKQDGTWGTLIESGQVDVVAGAGILDTLTSSPALMIGLAAGAFLLLRRR